MTNQSEYTNKEELDWAEQLYIESPSISLKEFRERIKALVAKRESALLSRIKEEVSINQKGQFEDDGGHVCWYLDDLLAKLDQLIKEIE